MSSPVAILMYHRFAEQTPAGFGPFTVAPTLFAEQLDALVETGCRFSTVGGLADVDAISSTSPTVVITVDDAFADFVTGALPALTARDIPATLFVPTAYVGGRAEWIPGDVGNLPMLGWSELETLPDIGIELGGHGHLHAAADGMRTADVVADAVECRLHLEEHVRGPVTSFAYPYGHQRRPARRAIAQAGYRVACTTLEALATAADDPFALPRLRVGPETTPERLIRRVLRRQPPWRRGYVHAKQAAWLAGRQLKGSRARGALQPALSRPQP